MPKSQIIFIIRQVGPYHHQRFQALAEAGLQVLVLETMPTDSTYAWETQFERAFYERQTLPKGLSKKAEIFKHATVFICGWYDKAMLSSLFAARIIGCRRIIISDSRAADAHRVGYKEAVKRSILKHYHGALVAGTESAAYLRQLGFAASIAKGWDVVNEKLWHPKEEIVKEDYWVFPARFIPEKNHLAFFRALLNVPSQEQTLIKCCGYGPLEAQVKSFVNQHADHLRVEFLGNQSLENLVGIMQKAKFCVLPSKKDTWGLVVNEALAAGTAVLVSKHCGAKELIQNGINGLIIDDVEQMEKQWPQIRDFAYPKEGITLPSNFGLAAFVNSVKSLAL